MIFKKTSQAARARHGTLLVTGKTEAPPGALAICHTEDPACPSSCYRKPPQYLSGSSLPEQRILFIDQRKESFSFFFIESSLSIFSR